MKKPCSITGYAELCDHTSGVIIALHPCRRRPGIAEAHIVIAPHNWTITARPPRPKASKKKGAKRK